MTIRITTATSTVERVNTYTSENQDQPQIAALPDGGYVIVWQSAGQDISFGETGVYSQRYDASGAKVGGEARVNTILAGSQRSPAVTALAGGGYVVTWIDVNNNASTDGVYGRFYDSSGAPLGSPVRLTGSSGAGLDALTGLAGGGFAAITLEGSYGTLYSLMLHVYDASGAAVGTPVLLTQTGSYLGLEVSVGALAGGTIVAAWAQNLPGSGEEVFVQRFNASGVAEGAAAVISTPAAGDLISPAVTVLSDGGYIISWMTESPREGHFRKYNASGTAEGTETILAMNSYGMTVAALSDGGFAMLSSSPALETHIFNAAGELIGGPVKVADIVASAPFPVIVGLAAGGYVVSWQGGPNISGSEIYQRLMPAAAISDTLSAAIQAASGDGADDVFLAPAGAIGAGDRIFGGGGHDQIRLTQSGTVNFAGVAVGGVEEIVGSSGDDTLIFTGSLPAGLSSIDSGGGHDTLVLSGDIDLSSLPTLTGDWQITAPAGTDQTFRITGAYQGTPLEAGTARIGIDASTTALDAGQRSALFAGGVKQINEQGGFVFLDPSTAYGLGPQRQVNLYDTDSQSGANVSALSDGGYVVVWRSDGQDGSGSGIYATRFTADGYPNGSEILVNTYTTNYQLDPRVAGLSGGGFVISWTSWGQDGSGKGVYAQRFDAFGVKAGAEVLVPAVTQQDQDYSDVAGLANGGYVISWASYENAGIASGYRVLAQQFDASGVRIGGAVSVSSSTTGDQFDTAVAGLSGGGFVVAWTHYQSPGAHVSLQRFDASGAKVGAEIVASTTLDGDQFQPDVAALADGGFVVTWTSDTDPLTAAGVITAQRFNASGSKVGGEIVVSTYVGDASQPNVQALGGGGFIVSWNSPGQDGSSDGVFSQRFDASGERVGIETRINATAAGTQGNSSGAVLSNGSYVAAFTVADLNNGNARIEQRISSAVETITLTSDSDGLVGGQRSTIVLATPATLTSVDRLGGGSQTDRLQLTQSGTVNLAAVTIFNSFEQLVGYSGDDHFIVSEHEMASLTSIVGLEGNDVIELALGATINPAAFTLSSVEQVWGSAQSDSLIVPKSGLPGGVIFDGRGGSDTVNVSASAISVTMSLTGSANLLGFENVIGSNQSDDLTGTAGANSLSGGNGIDYLRGLAGDDLLSGGGGDDYLYAGSGDDTLDGGSGYNTADYGDVGPGGMGNGSGVIIDLRLSGAQDTAGAGIDTFISIEGLRGSQYGDRLTGTDGGNVIEGQDGDDYLYGLAGSDLIVGGEGNDVLDGGAGNDSLRGSNGIDTASYQSAVSAVTVSLLTTAAQNTGGAGSDNISGVENLIGSAFNDTLTGDTGANALTGGDGADVLVGAAGDDTLSGGLGRDAAVYGVASSAATWSHNSDGSWTVTAGVHGTDTLTGVEVLRFNDRDVALSSRQDFNADGLSDILWRNNNGTVDGWLTTAGSDYDFTDANQGVIDTSWTIAQQGDFNGDGKNDLLWRHSGGNTNVWLSNAGTSVGFTGQGLGDISTAWQIQQAADFNGDGKTDVVWRNTDGTVNVWASNLGTNYTGFTGEGFGTIDNAWTIKGADDFNGDGRADMLWRHSSGAVNIWLSNTTSGPIGFTGDNLGVIPTDWTIQDTGDFNGDGKADILWRNASGNVNLWLSNSGSGFTGLTGNDLGAIPTDWLIKDVADYNGDGKADIAWRHTDGSVNIWMSNTGSGFTGLTGQYVGAVPNDWFIV